MTPLRWQRAIAVVIAIIAGVVCAALGWLSQDAAAHGPVILRGVRPAGNAAEWQYWLATIAWGGTAFGATLFVGWQDSIRMRHIALAGTLLFGGFAVEQWLGDGDDRYPVDASLRYEDAGEWLREQASFALPALIDAAEGDVEISLSTDWEDDSAGDDCYTEYAESTQSATLELTVEFDVAPDGWTIVRQELEQLGFVDQGPSGLGESLSAGAFGYRLFAYEDGATRLVLSTPCLPRGR